jgi:hypothetical protein
MNFDDVKPFDAALQEMLVRLEVEEINQIESQKDKVKVFYDQATRRLNRVSELTGIAPDMILQICATATRNYKDIKWYQMLELILSFHVTHERLKADAATKE